MRIPGLSWKRQRSRLRGCSGRRRSLLNSRPARLLRVRLSRLLSDLKSRRRRVRRAPRHRPVLPRLLWPHQRPGLRPVELPPRRSNRRLRNRRSVPPGAQTAEARPPQAVTLDWERLQEEVGHCFPNIAPFLEMGRLVAIEGNAVTIGFGKQATVARAMLEKADNIQALTSLCERMSGQPVPGPHRRVDGHGSAWSHDGAD